MQSSISRKLPRLVALQSRSRIRGISALSPSIQQQQPLFSECDNSNSKNYDRNQFRIRSRSEQQQPLSRRIHSTLSTTSFWRGLHQAVRQGNGNLAEEIAEQVLQDYYRLAMASQNDAYDSFHSETLVSKTASETPLLDSQVFSLVLQAWKNSDCASLHSALRAHNLLIQMAALADQDVLCDPPALNDYLAVLECWHQAAEASSTSGKKKKKNDNIDLVLQHAEELWNQMRERQRRETMTNQIPRFEINEQAYELFVSLLAKAGRAKQAERVVEEALAQQLGKSQKYAFVLPKEENDNSLLEEPETEARIGLDLCHAVLRAHLMSQETTAPQRSETFLQKMRTDPNLPKPDVNSYNLVLERWLASSKASRNHNAMATIASNIKDLMDQMKQVDRIQPNLVSYQYAIDAMARSGDAVRSETMLANLVKDYFLQYDADLKPTITPFQSVLWAYSKSRKLQDAAKRAESILNNMKDLSSMLDTYPTVWSYNVVLKCWANSKSPEAASRTMALYQDLQRASFESESTSEEIVAPVDLKPDTTSMNTVLNALSIHEGAVRTEQKLLEFCEAHAQDSQQNPSPDTIAFSTTINAWSNSSSPDAPEKADALLRKLIDLYETGKKKIHKPDIVTYTNVMQCWVKSKKSQAPVKAESILRELQRMEQEGDATMKPDAACWNSAISAWANAGNGERAEALFLEMVDGSIKTGGASPTPITLTNVLKAWAQNRSPEAPHRAIALLAKMEQLYKNGTLAVKPNVVNYSVVLDCLAYSRSAAAAERAEGMLQRMAESEDPNLHPNVVSYNCVIKAWSYAKDPESATRITAALRDLIDQSETNPKMRPNDNTFGTVLKFLADSDLPDKANRAKAIENLMDIFLERGPKPWIKKELQRCLSENNVESEIGATTNSASCRGKRANARFKSEATLQNLTRKPLERSNGNTEQELRDALVRVRLIENTNEKYNLVVVDGQDEFSCKVLNADNASEIKGGQFLTISYYWKNGEPVIVKMQDAIAGIEI
eukprot:CAMPEP_0116125186 /NCGR_PEP_ID=MMETSP0329-20121206/5675_1 /TAXON_ID=697910 /ORGANISM="Pseudo-nitzschia arenysensis, Strain B593" /LENGTH=1008 /DNA_ID=CAMNT_0003619207 /DNA_START=133 /DNA_END=3159 /DNA_ORIENTATION=+